MISARSFALGMALFAGSVSAYGSQYTFSAPPRGAADKEAQVYKPIAEYLSRVTGKTIVYKHPGDWLTYQNDMRTGAYDIVFDGPHFVSWRMARVQHEPLVSLPGKLAFVVVTGKDNQRLQSIEDLAGRAVCGLAPPNLATLSLYSLFPNPVRQPVVTEVKSFKHGYQAAMAGKKCSAAVMRDKAFAKLDKEGKKGRVIFKTGGIANQAFSAGPRFSAQDKEKIVQALLEPKAGSNELKAFFARFNKKNKPMMRATAEQYQAHAVLLKDVWGFDLAQAGQ